MKKRVVMPPATSAPIKPHFRLAPCSSVVEPPSTPSSELPLFITCLAVVVNCTAASMTPTSDTATNATSIARVASGLSARKVTAPAAASTTPIATSAFTLPLAFLSFVITLAVGDAVEICSTPLGDPGVRMMAFNNSSPVRVAARAILWRLRFAAKRAMPRLASFAPPEKNKPVNSVVRFNT